MKSLLTGVAIGSLLILTIKFLSTSSSSDVDSSFLNHNNSIVNKLERGLSSLEKDTNSQGSRIAETYFLKGENGVVRDTPKNEQTNEPSSPIKSELLEKQKQFQEYLSEDYRWWIENFEVAQNLQNEIITKKNELKYSLTEDDKINLKTNLVLSIILNLSIAEISNIDDFELSSYKWSLINNFVNSSDFDKMIKFKELNPVYLEFDNLAMYYGNSRAIISNENSKDIKNTTPSIEEDEKYEESSED